MIRNRKPEPKPLSETLDPAVMAAFPGVTCETSLNIFACRMETRWWKEGTEDEPLPPAKARRVKDFVAGFMAAMEVAHG